MDQKHYNELLTLAIDREKEAMKFYSEVASLLENVSLKVIFQELATEEEGHKNLLTVFLERPELSLSFPESLDYELAEQIQFPELSISMKPSEAIALAMKKEQQAVEFYTSLANESSDPDIKEKCNELAKMESGHKSRLENLYTDIAYAESF